MRQRETRRAGQRERASGSVENNHHTDTRSHSPLQADRNALTEIASWISRGEALDRALLQAARAAP